MSVEINGQNTRIIFGAHVSVVNSGLISSTSLSLARSVPLLSVLQQVETS